MSAATLAERLATPEFVRFSDLLLELQRKKAAGTDDDDRAEALRDESEALWRNLSQEQQQVVNGLSEDLFSLTDPPTPLAPPNPQFADAMARARQAHDAEEWTRWLELNRRWRTCIDPARLALRRAWAWRQLGLPNVAFAFADFGTKLDRLEFALGWRKMEALAAIDPAEPRKLLQRAEVLGDPLSPGEIWWLVVDAVDRKVADYHELSLVHHSAMEFARAPNLPPPEKELACKLAMDLGRHVLVCMQRGADWTGWCEELKRQAPALADLPLPPVDFWHANSSKLSTAA